MGKISETVRFHLDALKRSFGETTENIGKNGLSSEWHQTGLTDSEHNAALFHADNTLRTLVGEPAHQMMGGIVQYFGEGHSKYVKESSLPKGVSDVYYFTLKNLVSAGEGVGEGYAQVWTAHSQDDFSSGWSRFFGGLGVAASMAAGGLAGSQATFTLPSLTAIPSNGGLAYATTATVQVAEVTAVAGSIPPGILANAITSIDTIPPGSFSPFSFRTRFEFGRRINLGPEDIADSMDRTTLLRDAKKFLGEKKIDNYPLAERIAERLIEEDGLRGKFYGYRLRRAAKISRRLRDAEKKIALENRPKPLVPKKTPVDRPRDPINTPVRKLTNGELAELGEKQLRIVRFGNTGLSAHVRELIAEMRARGTPTLLALAKYIENFWASP